MVTIDVVGRPLAEAECLLQAAHIDYVLKRSRPVRDFFKIDEQKLYVVRQRFTGDGILQLMLAAKLRKEVSQDGL
jgi:hypothetical protein